MFIMLDTSLVNADQIQEVRRMSGGGVIVEMVNGAIIKCPKTTFSRIEEVLDMNKSSWAGFPTEEGYLTINIDKIAYFREAQKGGTMLHMTNKEMLRVLNTEDQTNEIIEFHKGYMSHG